jgi:hypothetical protein
MAQAIQLSLGASMIGLGVKGSTNSCGAGQWHQQYRENDSTNIGKSERH